MKNPYTPPSAGFTLLELLIIIVIVVLGSTWAVPQYQRRLALNQLDQYSQQIESGLFSLRARQSAEGTSCEININPSYVGTHNTNGGWSGTRRWLSCWRCRPSTRLCRHARRRLVLLQLAVAQSFEPLDC